MLKYDRAYVNVESEDSMCVIMKCNAVARMAYGYDIAYSIRYM